MRLLWALRLCPWTTEVHITIEITQLLIPAHNPLDVAKLAFLCVRKKLPSQFFVQHCIDERFGSERKRRRGRRGTSVLAGVVTVVQIDVEHSLLVKIQIMNLMV